MRHNFFGEPVAEPRDDYDHVAYAFNQHYNHEPEFKSAILYLDKDSHFLFGGVLDASNGESMDFDGFESLEAARTWLVETMNIPADVITEEE